MTEHTIDIAQIGLPDAWDGDPKAVEKFLGFVERQIGVILLNSMMRSAPEELTMRMRQLESDCKHARVFLGGYIAGMHAGSD